MTGYLDLQPRSIAEAQRARFAEGDRVHCARFGDGVVVAVHIVQGVAARDFADIRFDDGRERAVPLSRLVKPDLRVVR